MCRYDDVFNSIPAEIMIFASLFEGSCFGKVFETF